MDNMSISRRVAEIGRLISERPDTGEVETYKCLKCKDQEWVYFTVRKMGRDYKFAERCNCHVVGGWAVDSFGFPPSVSRLPLKIAAAENWAKTHTPGDVAHVVGHPKRTLEVGLAMATLLADRGHRPKYFSARSMEVDVAQSFLTSPLVLVGEVDGGLGAQRAKVLANAIRDAKGAVIVLGTATSKWPRWDSFAMLNIALRARDAREIKI